MNTRKRIALGFASLVLASGGLGGGVAVAADDGEATAQQPTSAAACTSWYDNAGPGGAYRGHAKCSGNVDVKVWVKCSDGSTHTSAWRFQYAKAECPWGQRGRFAEYDTRPSQS
ncbi:hypothetical protein HEK616_35400 [Streptomyces nigrescens]|uniref:Secreted protein n=2 Tax=Streptomyces TaxID=1883 RepID=A0ABM7ZV68_STRNI|nr:hypothetical protein [Streptomyces nigrescens]MEE4423313.1 hypothetical protein [Streptomyces sp. DSM 41528]BDM70053.1 hypothetical protein HEK616_35400 [Streptomyces nigrescens]